MDLTHKIIKSMNSKEYLLYRKEIKQFFAIEKSINRLTVYKFKSNDPIYQSNYYLKNIERLKTYKKEYHIRKKNELFKV